MGAAVPPTRRARSWAFRILRILLVPYLVLLAAMWFLQEWLIFPGRDSQGQPSAVISEPGEGAELVRLKTLAGVGIVALFGCAWTPDGKPLPDAATRPTLLYCYGNAMHLRECLYTLDDFRRLGVNVMIPEYEGFGMSEGSAGEQGCYAAAEAAWRHLRGRKDVDPARIVASGWSLGSAVAVDLAARHPEVAGLAVFSAFTRMADVAGREYPFVPVSLLLRHRFDSESKLPSVGCPVFFAQGAEDELIPFEMQERLAQASKGPVTRFLVERGDHNGLFVAGGEPLRQALRAFLEGAAR